MVVDKLDLSGQVAIIFNQFGPYHHARVKALQSRLPGQVIPAQIAANSHTYDWSKYEDSCEGLVTLCDGTEEDASATMVFLAAYRFFRKYKIRIVFLPSYSPANVLSLYVAATACGCRRIMMNESHSATEQAKGWKRMIKRVILKGFHSALVGGTPQKRHFEDLGIPSTKIFVGYDAIDNDYFSNAAKEVRLNATNRRIELQLPSRYFLNLGRFVEKKNLETLIQAYALFAKCSTRAVDLVLVGSGDQETRLKELAVHCGLRVHGPNAVIAEPTPEHSNMGYPIRSTAGEDCASPTPTVYFMGFRQIEENPTFYALAEAFIIPSVREEWGLVVNEAMACGLPVIVSRAVGCAEDLVQEGKNGFLFDPEDADALACCLIRLAGDEPLRQAMSETSQRIIADWGCGRFAENALRAIEAALNH
ncbi:glycosyltransferase family 4 protein [Crateriforma conspicua]|uniref:D-inositol 3-phosphate glycosyltransferase n=1 Tax=Crateriforma conspicua TaxID=2527996 RepID=A0A5C5XU43_9PLAN|nr:glycosyltransferase family 4 protein [Crateriforma conspicua]TWT65555.1 D-inositol 3-phosphate glycosyltransferase [Crateriforma conspicua]